jgi:hypothetical protein
MTAQEVVSGLHEALGNRGHVLAGFRPGDRVEVRVPGHDLVAFGEVAGWECHRAIGEQAVRLDGTGQIVRVPEAYLTREVE